MRLSIIGSKDSEVTAGAAKPAGLGPNLDLICLGIHFFFHKTKSGIVGSRQQVRLGSVLLAVLSVLMILDCLHIYLIRPSIFFTYFEVKHCEFRKHLPLFRPEKAEDSPQSDNMSDDLGRISPLDLNLTMDFPLDRASSLYSAAAPSQSSSVKAKAVKENHNVRRVHSQHATQYRHDDAESSKNENFNNSRDLVSKSVASLARDEVKPPVAKKPPPGVAPKVSVVKRGRLSQVNCYFLRTYVFLDRSRTA